MAFFKEVINCPVCKSKLGERYKDEIFVGHCEECRCTFIWKYKEKKPQSKLDCNKPKGCNCGGCGR